MRTDGSVRGKDIVCGVHNWDYNFKTGISSYNNEERLHKFNSWIEDGSVWVDQDEIREWEKENPQAYDRAIEKFRAAAEVAAGTPYVAVAHEQIERLSDARRAAVEEAAKSTGCGGRFHRRRNPGISFIQCQSRVF